MAEHKRPDQPVQYTLVDMTVLSEPDQDLCNLSAGEEPDSIHLSEGEENIQAPTYRKDDAGQQLGIHSPMVPSNMSNLDLSA